MDDIKPASSLYNSFHPILGDEIVVNVYVLFPKPICFFLDQEGCRLHFVLQQKYYSNYQLQCDE